MAPSEHRTPSRIVRIGQIVPSSNTIARECSGSAILLTTVSVRLPAVRMGRFVGVISTNAAPARSEAAGAEIPKPKIQTPTKIQIANFKRCL